MHALLILAHNQALSDSAVYQVGQRLVAGHCLLQFKDGPVAFPEKIDADFRGNTDVRIAFEKRTASAPLLQHGVDDIQFGGTKRGFQE